MDHPQRQETVTCSIAQVKFYIVTRKHTHTRTQIVRERTIGSSRACALLTETTAGRCKNKQQTKSGRTHTYTKYRYLPSQHRKERQLEAIARGSSLMIIVLALVKRPTTKYFSELDLGDRWSFTLFYSILLCFLYLISSFFFFSSSSSWWAFFFHIAAVAATTVFFENRKCLESVVGVELV